MTAVEDGELLKRLGVPLDTEALRLALTHRSYAYEHPGTAHNERLEFLGDAVLGLAVTTELYGRFPEEPEGDLAKRRAAVVSTRSLASIARALAVGPHVRLGKGEAASNGADKDSILADTMEALFGATYLSLGPEAARDLVLKYTADLLDDEFVLGAGRDWKTEIQELAAAEALGGIRYDVTGEGPEHARVYTARLVIGEQPRGAGTGRSKKVAERSAAEDGYRRLTQKSARTLPGDEGHSANHRVLPPAND